MQLQKPFVIFATVALAASLAGLVAVNVGQSSTMHDQNSTIRAQASTIGALAENSDALRGQVKDAGETPIAPPAAAVVDTAPATGDKGDRGLPGAPASTQDIAASVTAYCALRLDCSGPVGPVAPAIIPRDGIDGNSGTNGTNGADSTVPGVKGDPGVPGADSTVPGPGGAVGPAGEPPFSWTSTDAKGAAYTCTRTDPFDPARPTYQCAATTPTP